jgi:Zinc binding domain
MSKTCCPEPTNGCLCPQTASVGSRVDRQTVKALLTEPALIRLTAGEYYFCPDAGCEIVYFGCDGTVFRIADVRVQVWQKLTFGNRPICYCFGESEATIRAELERFGRSSAEERIRQHIAEDRCACEVRNPRGVCCLGDVVTAVKHIEILVRSAGVTDDTHDR